jgi:hypothetical protein
MSGGNTSMEEKRRFKRFEIDDYSVVVYRLGGLLRALFRRKNISRVVRNLSQGGVCVITERRVPLGAPVRFLLIWPLARFEL